VSRTRFFNAIVCPGCGHAGQVQWEENVEAGPRGLERALIGVSDGFRHEPQQQQMGRDPAIICDGCGTRQHD
jgi:hypothetical protein